MKKNVKVLKISQIEKHPTKDIMKWLVNTLKFVHIFPLMNIINIRDWFWNLLNSVAYNEFKKLIKNALKEREKNIVMKKQCECRCNTRDNQYLCKSTECINIKGKYYFLMRVI